ncbi:hypothetical protein Patl1_29414 [Pistacia atlantica]|uniref:Uncharacterized protein n=1 Tax=Pistacia atlantica TaxID=434234 RepID=A0ACC1ACQ8_9ROSI|nr:hypothetical protein Patl1_29414 [Pistacia atlantica]
MALVILIRDSFFRLIFACFKFHQIFGLWKRGRMSLGE